MAAYVRVVAVYASAGRSAYVLLRVPAKIMALNTQAVD